MNKKRGSIKTSLLLVLIAILIFALTYIGITFTKNFGKSKSAITTENSLKNLNELYKTINTNKIKPVKATIDLMPTDLKDTLPDISKYPAQVKNTTDSFIEIFSSPEKTGEGKDGFLLDVARDFNNSAIEVNGKKVSICIRGLASGMAKDYISSGKYTPDAFTPSNELWGKMIEAEGIPLTLVDKKMLGNVAGVVLSKKKNEELIKKYGAINLKNITEAVKNNEIAMGYTNPFASSTGLNFLVTTLSVFDSKEPLSQNSISAFENFQSNIPFVSYTTLQMRESAKSGVLDGFILEYQTYVNSPELHNDYVFTPFGARHDSPLYEVGSLSAEKKEILSKFIEFYKGSQYQKLATDYGFNNYENYKSEIAELDGSSIISAQKIWKEKKNSNKPIVAVFVADTSGSMEGEPLNKLKKSLISASKYIGSENSIGIVTYSDEVNINLPINKFDINQRSLFQGAVNEMNSGGATATFDAIIVATKLLMDEKEKNPDAKLMLFVLSDGETNRGYSLNDIEGVIQGLKIPIHTIGYNANISALENISNINEAANINADLDDVVYKLGSLFNAEM